MREELKGRKSINVFKSYLKKWKTNRRKEQIVLFLNRRGYSIICYVQGLWACRRMPEL